MYPALEPEQWEYDEESGPGSVFGTNPKLGIFARAEQRQRTDSDNVNKDEQYVVDVRLLPGRNHETLSESDRLGLAAVCLYRHPQGFTRQDVLALRAACSPSDDDAQRVIAKIDALLPPGQ